MMANNQGMSPSMHSGGIDQQITDRITSANGNPQELMGRYGDSKSILDLIAAQRAADLVKEQKRQLALEMNSSPVTVADQLEKELVDGQKAEMRGPLEGLKNLRGGQNQGDKTRGVAGVLANQQRQQQQQMQGRGQPRPQGQQPTMNVAHGGIINAPAPNLNRMYNGGIVGYAGKEGSEVRRSLTKEQIDAYINQIGFTRQEIFDATPDQQARIMAEIQTLVAKDRTEGAKQADPQPNFLGALSAVSPAQQKDRGRRERKELYDASVFSKGPLTKEEILSGPKEVDPNEAQKAAEGQRDLADVTLEDILAPIKAQKQESFDSYTATMEDPKFGASGKDQFARGAPNIAEGLDDFAKYPKFNKKPEPEPEPELSEQDRITRAMGAPVDDSSKKTGITGVLPEGNGYSPVMTREERGQKELQDLGLDKKQDISALEPFMRKPEVNRKQSLVMTPEQQAEANKPLSGSALIQKQLDAMRGKKGIAGLVERFANTDFQKSYGGTYEALAQGGRDIAKTGRKETARQREFLEGQLGVQQSIEAADVLAKEGTRQYDVGVAEGKRQYDATLAEKVATRNQASGEFTKKFDQLGKQFDATLAQNSKYQDATIRVQEATLKLQGLMETNKAGQLRNQTLLQAGEILRKLEIDYRELINEEVAAIMDAPTSETPAAKQVKADAHKKMREAELRTLRRGITGVVGGSGGAGGGAEKDAASKILGI